MTHAGARVTLEGPLGLAVQGLELELELVGLLGLFHGGLNDLPVLEADGRAARWRRRQRLCPETGGPVQAAHRLFDPDLDCVSCSSDVFSSPLECHGSTSPFSTTGNSTNNPQD